MATDLTIQDITTGVTDALINWGTGGISGLVGDIGDILFNDTPEIDSLADYQNITNEKLDVLNENVVSLNTTMTSLNNNIDSLSKTIDSFLGYQFFFFTTIFTLLFVGFITTRVKRLFSWRKLKRNEGYL